MTAQTGSEPEDPQDEPDGLSGQAASEGVVSESGGVSEGVVSESGAASEGVVSESGGASEGVVSETGAASEGAASERGAATPLSQAAGVGGSQYVLWSKPIPRLRDSTLITAFEGWNDAGSAATMAALHLATRWGGETVAEIDPELFYDFTSTRPTVHLDEQQNRYLKWPSNKLWTAQLTEPALDVALLVGVEPQLRWRTFCEQVISVAEMLDVKRVLALGSLLAEIPHSRPVEVYGTADAEIAENEFKVSPSTYEGPTGIIGVLTTACRDAGYPTASFWASVPSYTPGTPSPKAALALVSRVCSVVASPVKTMDLEQASRAYEQELNQLAQQNEETAEYIARIERKWDDRQERRDAGARRAVPGSADTPLEDDPTTLLAEVEQFLREAE